MKMRFQHREKGQICSVKELGKFGEFDIRSHSLFLSYSHFPFIIQLTSWPVYFSSLFYLFNKERSTAIATSKRSHVDY